MQTTQVVQTGIWDLISQSGPVAQIVLLILLGASIASWAIIFRKWKTLGHAQRENKSFLDLFWKSKSIDEIFSQSEDYTVSPVATLFKSGFKELRKLNLHENETAKLHGIDNINRALSRTANAEISFLEKNVAWLATIASAAPFVGLFGTVWGIMNSFQNIGATGSANLAVVAPGISEALITTAMGLAAAIPAVIGYNQISGQIRRVSVDMENFAQDFLNIIQRSLGSGANAKKGH